MAPCFFLLPLANQDGCMIIIDRIKQAVEQLISTEIGKGLSMSIGYMTSAEIINSSLDDELVMAELKTRMLESNLCIVGNK